MTETIDFELVSPEKLLFSEPVEMVVVPGVEGDLGVLPGHAPLIASLRPGVIDIHEGGSIKKQIFVGGGFCEIGSSRCTVLATEAIPTDQIDKSKALEREAEVKKQESDPNTDKTKLERERRIAQAMVAALN